MNLLYIGKYPPIQGGTSSAAYWRLLHLKKHGIKPYIVTAINLDSDFIINEKRACKSQTLLSKKTKWHIPYSQLYAERLISKSLEIIKNNKITLIEGNYVYPFGFAAYVASKITNIPYIIRHAGSDLKRLAANDELLELSLDIFKNAYKIITYKDLDIFWDNISYNGNNFFYSYRYAADPFYFFPRAKLDTAIFLGKITELWDETQIDFFYDELRDRNFKGKIIFYTNNLSKEIYTKINKYSDFICEFNNFVHPKKIPPILSVSQYVLSSNVPYGIIETSNIVQEGLSCGCEVISRDNVYLNSFSEYIENQLKIYAV